MRLKVASRKSDLARWQSVQVARAFETLSERPHIEYIFKASLGDQNLDVPLASMGSKGVFTEDFYADLKDGQCDLVVHSWKDLPVEEREDTRIAMTLKRADTRDLLLVPEVAWQAAVKAGRLRVLTSSPRRVYNLEACLRELLPAPVELEFVNVRGNVPTRLGKMKEQNSALILAKAGLDRLLHAEGEGFLTSEVSLAAIVRECRFMVLPLSLNPGAPAQGALAVEILQTRDDLSDMCARLTDEATAICVREERRRLAGYGGGCHQKIGITTLDRPYGRLTSLRGLTDQGEVLESWRIDNDIEWTKAQRENVFPLHAQENSWFGRTPYKPSATDLAHRPALFVARAQALPEGFTPQPQQLVWTAGARTWRQLAARGVWVHGTHDGLGESEPMGLESLVGEVQWTKLTHTRGNVTAWMEIFPTYELVHAANPPDLRGKTHFFWMSSTSFERARQLFPAEVQSGYNACGPGSTFEFLSRQQDLKHPPKVFAGLEQFLFETLS